MLPPLLPRVPWLILLPLLLLALNLASAIAATVPLLPLLLLQLQPLSLRPLLLHIADATAHYLRSSV